MVQPCSGGAGDCGCAVRGAPAAERSVLVLAGDGALHGIQLDDGLDGILLSLSFVLGWVDLDFDTEADPWLGRNCGWVAEKHGQMFEVENMLLGCLKCYG